MRLRWLFVLLALTVFGAACGSQDTSAPADEAPPEEASPIAGLYEVSGATVDKRTGAKRQISGKMILAENGSRYTSTFHLTTTFPGGGDPIGAEVIGKGDGSIDGRVLTGSAETQIVMATVPGVDPGFAYVPRQISTRIVSTSVATIAADGTAHIEIENQPAEGEEYAPTRTTLRGRRVSAAGLGGEELLPPPSPE